MDMDPRGVMVVCDDGAQRGPGRPPGRPEALEQVANQPIAYHVLDALEGAGIEQVVVAAPSELTGAVRECLTARKRPACARLQYVERDGPLNLSGALSLAAPVVGAAPCVVHLASGLLGEPLAPFVDLLRADSPDMIVIVHQGIVADGHLSPAAREMLQVAELDPDNPNLGVAGIWLFGPNGLRRASMAAPPVGGEVELTELAERLAVAGRPVQVRLGDTWRRYAGDPLELLEVNRLALDRLQAGACHSVNHGNQIEGRVQIHESAVVRASMIVGPTIIGPGAHIADAYIGPYTSVGAGVRIEGSEVERSIILSGASVMHVGERLVASVVGRKARVFRDFSLPRAMRVRLADGDEVALR